MGKSDAWNIFMGGFCFPLFMQWRHSKSVFRCLPDWRDASPDDPAFHINIHEFVALIINDFFMIISFTNLQRKDIPILPNLDRWILLMEAYNTYVISWMYRFSRMQ